MPSFKTIFILIATVLLTSCVNMAKLNKAADQTQIMSDFGLARSELSKITNYQEFQNIKDPAVLQKAAQFVKDHEKIWTDAQHEFKYSVEKSLSTELTLKLIETELKYAAQCKKTVSESEEQLLLARYQELRAQRDDFVNNTPDTIISDKTTRNHNFMHQYQQVWKSVRELYISKNSNPAEVKRIEKELKRVGIRNF